MYHLSKTNSLSLNLHRYELTDWAGSGFRRKEGRDGEINRRKSSRAEGI